MVNPGIFQGSRKQFLLDEKSAYAAGIEGQHVKDALAGIQRRYFKRYPIDLPLDEEPSPESLAAVDDDAAETETEAPSEDGLSPEEYTEAVKEFEKRGKLLQQRKMQISRWMAYQYAKDQNANLKDTGAKNPYSAYIQQLTGVGQSKPRLQPATKLWRQTKRSEIETETLQRAATAGVSKKNLAPIREKVVKEWFSELSTAEQKEWSGMAEAEHKELMAKYKDELKAPVPTDPQSRQRAIQGLVHVVEPLLEAIAVATGWKATLIAGGPEPAHGGKLNCIAIHHGSTSGDVKMNFGRAEQTGFTQHVFPLFSSFLRKCYSPEECHGRALPSEHDAERLHHLPFENADMHSEESLQPTSSQHNTQNTSGSNSIQDHTLVPRRGTTTPPQTPAPSRPGTPLQSPVRRPSATPPLEPNPPSRMPTPSPPQQPPMSIAGITESSQQQLAMFSTHTSESTVASAQKRKSDQADKSSEPNSKRQRRVTLEPDPKPPSSVISPSSPAWFNASMTMFEAGDFGEEWHELLREWASFEASNCYSESARLGAKNRPKVIGDWVKSARPTTWRPSIGSVTKFEREISVWWTSLQPAWRCDPQGQLKPSETSGDWTSLHLPGLNGLLSFIAGLYAWASVLDDVSKSREWQAIVRDVHLALKSMKA